MASEGEDTRKELRYEEIKGKKQITQVGERARGGRAAVGE